MEGLLFLILAAFIKKLVKRWVFSSFSVSEDLKDVEKVSLVRLFNGMGSPRIETKFSMS